MKSLTLGEYFTEFLSIYRYFLLRNDTIQTQNHKTRKKKHCVIKDLAKAMHNSGIILDLAVSIK